MTVRAKFKCDAIELSLGQKPDRKPDGSLDWHKAPMVEKRTIRMSPVYANGDASHENSKFWDASPSGRLELCVVNPEAWKHFEIGKEYYLDFSSAS